MTESRGKSLSLFRDEPSNGKDIINRSTNCCEADANQKQDLYSIRTQSFCIDGSDSEEDEEEIGCRH